MTRIETQEAVRAQASANYSGLRVDMHRDSCSVGAVFNRAVTCIETREAVRAQASANYRGLRVDMHRDSCPVGAVFNRAVTCIETRELMFGRRGFQPRVDMYRDAGGRSRSGARELQRPAR